MTEKEIPITFVSENEDQGQEPEKVADTVQSGEAEAANAEADNEQGQAAVEADSEASDTVEPESETPQPVEDELQREIAELRGKLEALTQERSTLYDQLLRRQAEFENFRKRQEKEKIEFQHRLRAETVLELLPILDNFERALDSLEKSGGEAQSLITGIELIHRQFRDVLNRMGLQPVESVGQIFDPNFHEAVTTEPTAEHEENMILEEFQRGYKLGDKLLRPAKVKVAAAPDN